MTPLRKRRGDELLAALLVARENENRWMELSPEASADGERMAQWASVAKLRRIEVERIEALLTEMGASIQQGAAGFEP
jgi:hypothetical protein